MKVIIKKTQRVLDDIFKVDRSVVQFEKFDGRLSRDVVRLNFVRGDAVAALLINRSQQKVVLVKQFRFPVYTKQPEKSWLLEIVAGVIDDGESPQETIIREIAEETGYMVDQVQAIGFFYPSPGASNEIIYLYSAEVKAKQQQNQGGGVAAEDEDIQVVEFSFDEIFSLLESGEIVDGKTIIALQWLRANIT
ncbi:MAG TPA: NUDIX hydrolase [bacterium]|nr:NUDIX hydrolase [bacterium]